MYTLKNTRRAIFTGLLALVGGTALASQTQSQLEDPRFYLITDMTFERVTDDLENTAKSLSLYNASLDASLEDCASRSSDSRTTVNKEGDKTQTKKENSNPLDG